MISDEKMGHIVHLMLEGLERAGHLRLKDKEACFREAKRAALAQLKHFGGAEEAARQRIASQKNAPPEFSPQWQTLYQKYYEEELQKRGG